MTNRISIWVFLMIGMSLAQVAFADETAIPGVTTSLVEVLGKFSTIITFVFIFGGVIYGVKGNFGGLMLSLGAAIAASVGPPIFGTLFVEATDKQMEATSQQSVDGTMFMYIGLIFSIILAIVAIKAASSIRSEREDILDEIRSRRVSVPEEPEIPSIGQLQNVPEMPQERNVEVAVERNKRKIVL